MNSYLISAGMEHNGTTVNIYHVSQLPSGYGHRKITVTIEYNGDTKEFSQTTSDMPGFDEAMDLEGDEKTQALYNLIDVDDEIFEWLYSHHNEN